MDKGELLCLEYVAFSCIYFKNNQPPMMGKLKNKQTEKLKQVVISEASSVFSSCWLSCSVLTLTVDTHTGRGQSPCSGLACSRLSARAGPGQVAAWHSEATVAVVCHSAPGAFPWESPFPGWASGQPGPTQSPGASHWAGGVVAGLTAERVPCQQGHYLAEAIPQRLVPSASLWARLKEAAERMESEP